MVSLRHRVLFIFILVDIVDQTSFSGSKTCPDGLIGQTCNISCRYPSYGKACQSNCNCHEMDCDAETGCKAGSPTVSPELPTTTMKVSLVDRTSTSGCPLGYTGSGCNISCRYPSFGAGCQAMCQCTEEHCNHIRGCNANNVCASENGSRHEAMLYSIAVLCVWTVIQLSVYFYLVYYFKSGSYGYFL